MTRFEYIQHLYWLAALLPLTLAFVWYVIWKSRAIKRLGELQLLDRLMPLRSKRKHIVKFVLVLLAFTSLIIAYANPQIGKTFEKVKRSGIDVIIAVDVSRSMLAEDIKPNRMARARQFVSRIIDELQNDRVGLIVFAGNAYLQMPLTSDKAAAKLFLKTMDTEMVPTQGTAIADAINLARKSFELEEKQFKSLIIITDGENHEGEAIEAAEQAADLGIVINTVGVGDPKGAPIPVNKRGGSDFKRDRAGNIVLSKLNETMLQQVAVKGNGDYFRLNAGVEELNALVEKLNTMEKKDFDEKVVTDYEDQYQYFILLAIILLTLEFLISDRKSLWLRNWSLFRSTKPEET